MWDLPGTNALSAGARSSTIDEPRGASRPSSRLLAAGLLLLASLAPRASLADTALDAAAPPPRSTPAEKRAGYSLPWLLRPAVAPDLVRVDSAIGKYDGGTTIAPTLTAGGKPLGELPLGFYGRVAVVHDSKAEATIVSNPLAYALFTPELAPSLKLSLFGGVGLPLGAGGGNSPSLTSRAAASAGIWARQGMDSALFATNYLTGGGGVGLAWVGDGLTAQVEVTVLELVRAKGADFDKDSSRTNMTSGVHLGYQIVPLLTASVEAHYQRWLSTPLAVEKSDSLRQQATVGAGLRLNMPLSATTLMRPGVAYFHPLDDPMSAGKYRVIQVDVPVAF